MGDSDVTRWPVIRGAAEGQKEARETFASRYLPPVRAYLGARWRGTPHLADVEDAAQEVFFECFRGVLSRADPEREGGFRALLYGVVRNVALRIEERRRKRREFQSDDSRALDHVPADEDALSHAFDRAWAQSIMDQARERQRGRARESGPEAERRCELLRLRFEEEIPIRDIARSWAVDATALHHEYARARQDFRAALLDVVGLHQHGSPEEIEALSGPVPRILLRDVAEEAPVLRPGTEEGSKAPSRYQVVGEIARGGIGVVMKSRDTDPGRDVAMKVLQRFVEEAQIGASCSIPASFPSTSWA